MSAEPREYDFGDGAGPVPAHRHRNPDGTVGGWVADTAKVSENVWVFAGACVYENARVSQNAWIAGNVRVYGHAWIYGNARLYGNVHAYGYAQIYGEVWVHGNVRIVEPLLSATRADGYTFLCAPSPEGLRILAFCRNFSVAEAREHWTRTRGGTPLGEESLAIVDHLVRCAAIRGWTETVA